MKSTGDPETEMAASYLEVSKGNNYRGRYLCIDKSLFTLAWSLYVSPNRCLRYLGFGRKTILKLILHKIRCGDGKNIIELPVEGWVCLKVNNGFLVFDFRRNTVVKLFDPETDTMLITNEIGWMKIASKLDFVPSLLRFNLHERWYEMEYVIGISGHSISTKTRNELFNFTNTFEVYLLPFIEQMITLQPPQSVGLREYAAKLRSSLRLDRLLCAGLNELAIDKVDRFIGQAYERLDAAGDCQVNLVFTHGDFSTNNCIKTGNRIAVLDWEEAGTRSFLHDLFNYIFCQMRSSNMKVHESMINRFIISLRERLAEKGSCMVDTLSGMYDTYRLLYYIERISILLRRGSNENRFRDIIIPSVILPSIDNFIEYEQNLNALSSDVHK